MKDKKLTPEDLQDIETSEDIAIPLIRKYASNYSGKVHYSQLGASYGMSVVGTVDTVIGSAEYLDGHFIMPDQINVQKLANWYIENKGSEDKRDAITFFMAEYIKRKINELYRSIKKDSIPYYTTLAVKKESFDKYNEEIQKRKDKGVKIIRLK
ncbi:hypothetical protein ACFO3D_14415 [Virgibacillus kekensis]|uniref:Uncharacterized protein n=1 Tax=Virgibacillus kekensis TaxID=202261 RepID=A0ABV9DMR8_9BACI